MTVFKRLKSLFQSKTLLSYDELVDLVADGVIDAPIENINGSSIDVTLDDTIMVEAKGAVLRTVRLYKGESIDTIDVDMSVNGEYIMMPDSVCLASTREVFNLPLNISAEFSLKSTIGRNFLGHMLAGWIDPGFSGKITLELKNDNTFHKLAIAPGMKIGQVKYFRHSWVPESFSYKRKGQYNGQTKATPAGILK